MICTPFTGCPVKGVHISYQCHLVSNQDMLDLLLDRALVMLLLP